MGIENAKDMSNTIASINHALNQEADSFVKAVLEKTLELPLEDMDQAINDYDIFKFEVNPECIELSDLLQWPSWLNILNKDQGHPYSRLFRAAQELGIIDKEITVKVFKVKLIISAEINGELREIKHNIDTFEMPSNILDDIEPCSTKAFELISNRSECPKKIENMMKACEAHGMSFLLFDFTWDTSERSFPFVLREM